MKIRICTLYASLAAAVTLALTPSADAGVFLKFDGIVGESQDTKHDGWSDLLSFGYSLEREPSSGAGGQQLKINDIVCVKELDKASPLLAQALLTGQTMPKVTIDSTKIVGDGSEQSFLTVELTKVQLVTNKVNVKSDIGEVSAEELSFNYETIKVTYTSFDSAGRPTGTVEYEWDVINGGPLG